MKSDIVIRKATLEDAAGIAHVHIHSRLTSYTGIVDQGYLDDLATEEHMSQKIEKRNKILQREVSFTYIVLIGGKIVGFTSGGPQRVDKLPVEGEMYAIYMLEEYKGKGIGGMLFRKMMEELRGLGYTSVGLWVLAKNKKASGFYAHIGGKQMGKDSHTMTGKEYILDGWVFDN